MNISVTLRNALHQAKDRASDFAGKHSDSIGSALDKATARADKATKGRYSQRIISSRDKARHALDKAVERHPHHPV
jgi:hypothetical protein